MFTRIRFSRLKIFNYEHCWEYIYLVMRFDEDNLDSEKISMSNETRLLHSGFLNKQNNRFWLVDK